MNFDDIPDHVGRYASIPPMFVPGYEASHDMAAAVLGDRIGDEGHLLVIGAGGGIEMEAFASHYSSWQMTGVDPSADMLALVRQRLNGGNAKFELHKATAIEAPQGPFDAATAFLCLSFTPDDGERLAQLCAIHARLKPGAPFLMIHAASDPENRERDFARFARHAQLRGAADEMINAGIAMNRTSVHILSHDREIELLEEAGFRFDGLFYKGLWVNGWEATACSSPA